jgi:glycosyltransferase involved in cell wall biosynthesis
MHDVYVRPSRPGLLGKLEIWYVHVWVQPYLLRTYADAIIVHGSLLKDQLSSKKVNPSKVYVIPHFDYKYLLQSGSTANPKGNPVLKDYILVFGHIVPYKGIEVLINAARVVRQISKKDVDIVIAGSGDTSHIHKILTDEDRRHIFIRNEWIPSNEIHDLFTRSKFLVLPYIDASQSGVLSLSYTFSKAVIVSRAGSLSEYVEHGKTGFIFDVNNTEQLANYIIQLYEDEHLSTEMGNRAYQKVSDQMSLELCCRLVNSMYESIELRKH